MNKKTILIVEDDAILAIDLQRILSQLGYAVAGPFSSDEEAIIFLTDHMVDLVLMDIELAGRMNGITTAETLNRTSDIPIVFLTGFSQDPLLEQAKIAAPYGYLIKPVPERELAATMEIALHRRVLDQKLKESQIALAESEARYRHLFENSSLGIFRTTIDGKVLAINSQMARILGYDTPDEARREFTDLAKQLYVDQDQRQEFITLLKENGFINNFKYCGRKKNGKTVWISMNAKLTAIDELSGQTAEFVIDGFAMDITESKKAEEALRESEEKFRTMASNTYDWEYWTDPDGRLIYTSPACERITGYKAASFQQDPDLLCTVIHPHSSRCRWTTV